MFTYKQTAFSLHVVQLVGPTQMQFYQWEEGRLKGLLMDKGNPKNQPHHIIQAFDLTALKFNGILSVDFLEIQSYREWRFSECKIGVDARSWDEKTTKGASPYL